MVDEGDIVAVFNSIHRVMKAERHLKDCRLPILVIPAPRAISTDCGLAIRYGQGVRAEVEAVLKQHNLAPEQIFVKQGERFLEVTEMAEKKGLHENS